MVHYPVLAPEYSRLVFGLLEMGAYEFATGRGVSLADVQFDHALVRKSLLYDDRCDIVQDIVASLSKQISWYLHTGFPEHRFGFKVLRTGDVIVGLDPRDFATREDQLKAQAALRNEEALEATHYSTENNQSGHEV